MDQEKAAHIIGDVVEIFGGLKLTPFLTCGTLLGYHRENRFIEWDLDLDIGVFLPPNPDIIREAFLKHGYTCPVQLGMKEAGLEFGFKKKELQYKIDVFFYYFDKERDLYWQAVWKGMSAIGDSGLRAQMLRYNYFNFKLKEIVFCGHKICVPDDVERFIVMQYGPNWREPDKNWSWWQSPKNLEKTNIIKPWQKLGWHFNSDIGL